MRLSAVEKYGLRCLIALARKGSNGQLSISEIAQLEGLSIPYTSKLLSILRRAGLVTAVRGRGGGFRLKQHPSKVNLLEAITSLGGPLIALDNCTRYTGQLDRCVHVGNCSLYVVLHSLAEHLGELLSSTSLQDLIDSKKLTTGRVAVSRLRTTGPLLTSSLTQKTNNSSKQKVTNVGNKG